nr:hypothetical protein Itr_chr08CG12020 [Ipomoea trifida]
MLARDQNSTEALLCSPDAMFDTAPKEVKSPSPNTNGGRSRSNIGDELEAHDLLEMMGTDEVPALPEDPTIAQMREYRVERKMMNKANSRPAFTRH